MVSEMAHNEDQEILVDLLKEAPLKKFDSKSKIVYISNQTNLIKAMQHMSEKEWIGVDMEHTNSTHTTVFFASYRFQYMTAS